MDASDVLKSVIERIRTQYIEPMLEEEKKGVSDFKQGQCFGFQCALMIIQNDVATLMGEEFLKDYNLALDIMEIQNSN